MEIKSIFDYFPVVKSILAFLLPVFVGKWVLYIIILVIPMFMGYAREWHDKVGVYIKIGKMGQCSEG